MKRRCPVLAGRVNKIIHELVRLQWLGRLESEEHKRLCLELDRLDRKDAETRGSKYDK